MTSRMRESSSRRLRVVKRPSERRGTQGLCIGLVYRVFFFCLKGIPEIYIIFSHFEPCPSESIYYNARERAVKPMRRSKTNMRWGLRKLRKDIYKLRAQWCGNDSVFEILDLTTPLPLPSYPAQYQEALSGQPAIQLPSSFDPSRPLVPSWQVLLFSHQWPHQDFQHRLLLSSQTKYEGSTHSESYLLD